MEPRAAHTHPLVGLDAKEAVPGGGREAQAAPLPAGEEVEQQVRPRVGRAWLAVVQAVRHPLGRFGGWLGRRRRLCHRGVRPAGGELVDCEVRGAGGACERGRHPVEACDPPPAVAVAHPPLARVSGEVLSKVDRLRVPCAVRHRQRGAEHDQRSGRFASRGAQPRDRQEGVVEAPREEGVGRAAKLLLHRRVVVPCREHDGVRNACAARIEAGADELPEARVAPAHLPDLVLVHRKEE
mmetsp:Transcript_28878/g.85306  ORF Transcript_28878/g.85306 Transcript_28878/m.85306 type:complete len:239 (-) Transcript_28878:543-1259(-)